MDNSKFKRYNICHSKDWSALLYQKTENWTELYGGKSSVGFFIVNSGNFYSDLVQKMSQKLICYCVFVLFTILVNFDRQRTFLNWNLISYGSYPTKKEEKKIHFDIVIKFYLATKEYIERRHGEPFKFLFLPKIGLLGSQAVLEKKVQFWIMSNFLAPFFQLFIGNFFSIFFYIVTSTLKSCLIKKVLKNWKKFGKYFLGGKNWVFKG